MSIDRASLDAPPPSLSPIPRPVPATAPTAPTGPGSGAEDAELLPLTEAAAEEWLARTSFSAGPPGRIGVELEFLLHPVAGPGHLPPARLGPLFHDLAGRPFGSRFTVEPGGQVELSSRPADDLDGVVAALERDLALLSSALHEHGARAVGAGVDPRPLPERYLDSPRYAAMEHYLDRWGRSGRTMMRGTASVQVNVEAGIRRPGGGGPDLSTRWHRLHALGPLLAAAFATSAGAGFAGRRQAVWMALDPARCRAPRVRPGEQLPQAWARWALDAPVMATRRPSGSWVAPSGLSFRTWIRAGRRAVPDRPAPSRADLEFHLTTLFPPVRARGHLEVRYVDAQPGPWWRVPPAVITAVLDDEVAAGRALAAAEPLAGRHDGPETGADRLWSHAARAGLGDPAWARAAAEVMDAAAAALDRSGRPALAELTHGYLDRRPRTPQEATPC